VETWGADVRNRAVKGLAVEVDDPHDLAELGHHGVEDCLPDGAFIEFGVSEE